MRAAGSVQGVDKSRVYPAGEFKPEIKEVQPEQGEGQRHGCFQIECADDQDDRNADDHRHGDVRDDVWQ